MKLLSIDTSSNICSVAILEDGNLIDELNIVNSKTHSENLMPLIDNLFKKNDLSLADISAIACSIGPGSFTGIRIGIASVKAMAEVMNIPVIGVTSLETLAYLNTSPSGYTVSLIDAKNTQVYCGIFNDKLNNAIPYIADDINEVINKLKEFSPITFVGNGSILHKELLIKNLENVSFLDEINQSAFALGKCAFNKWKNNETLTADTLFPLYLRKSQAERMKNNG